MRSTTVAALVCSLLASLWITFTVQRNYRGSTTGLFCIGDFFDIPPELKQQRPLHRFAGSRGFDGQFYLVVAHDPTLRLGHDRFVDWPSLRYRRILVPLLANLSAFSLRDWIPFSYVCWILAFLFLGVWCSGTVSRGIVFATLPVTWITLDRMVLDMPCLALFVATLWLWDRGNRFWCVLPLMLAALTRESGALLGGAFALAALLDGFNWRLAGLLLGSTLPAIVWSGWLSSHFDAHLGNWTQFQLNSFGVFATRLGAYPVAQGLERILLPLDLIAFFALLTVLVWGLMQFRRRDPLGLVAFLQALLCVYLICVEDWTHVYDHGRLSAPILLAMGYAAVSPGRRRWLMLLPAAVMTFRVAAQMSPQIYRF